MLPRLPRLRLQQAQARVTLLLGINRHLRTHPRFGDKRRHRAASVRHTRLEITPIRLAATHQQHCQAPDQHCTFLCHTHLIPKKKEDKNPPFLSYQTLERC
jgi:hypothetical protein